MLQGRAPQAKAPQPFPTDLMNLNEAPLADRPELFRKKLAVWHNIHIYTYIHTCTHVYTHIHAFMYVYMYMCVDMYKRSLMHVCGGLDMAMYWVRGCGVDC